MAAMASAATHPSREPATRTRIQPRSFLRICTAPPSLERPQRREHGRAARAAAWFDRVRCRADAGTRRADRNQRPWLRPRMPAGLPSDRAAAAAAPSQSSQPATQSPKEQELVGSDRRRPGPPRRSGIGCRREPKGTKDRGLAGVQPAGPLPGRGRMTLRAEPVVGGTEIVPVGRDGGLELGPPREPLGRRAKRATLIQLLGRWRLRRETSRDQHREPVRQPRPGQRQPRSEPPSRPINSWTSATSAASSSEILPGPYRRARSCSRAAASLQAVSASAPAARTAAASPARERWSGSGTRLRTTASSSSSAPRSPPAGGTTRRRRRGRQPRPNTASGGSNRSATQPQSGIAWATRRVNAGDPLRHEARAATRPSWRTHRPSPPAARQPPVPAER